MAHLKSFSIRLLFFSLFTLALLCFWKQFASDRFQSNMMVPIWIFFIVSTFLIHFILVKAAEKDPNSFVGYFMGITGIKLFGYLIIITIYALLKREVALVFTLWFLVLYLLYSGFEVVMLLKHFKK